MYGEKFSALPRAGRAAKVWTLANPTHRCSASTFELVIQIGEVASKMSQFDPDIKIRYAVRESRCTGRKIAEIVIIGTPGQSVVPICYENYCRLHYTVCAVIKDLLPPLLLLQFAKIQDMDEEFSISDVVLPNGWRCAGGLVGTCPLRVGCSCRGASG